MKEDDLKRAVIELCRHLGLLVHHCRPARLANGKWRTPIEGNSGFPDLVITGPGGVLFRELKAEHAYPTKEQRRWLNALEDAGANVWVWKPRDLRGGVIERELRVCVGRQAP